jgi:hypothetical protein
MFDFDFNSPFCVNAVGRQLHFFFLFSWGDVVLRLSSSLCVSPIQQLAAVSFYPWILSMDRRGYSSHAGLSNHKESRQSQQQPKNFD